MRVADVVVEFISRYCSSKVFLLTGNGAMYLNDAMQTNADIEYICVRNETVAPLAAMAYSKLTRKIGTVCVTAGPGAANAMPGVVEAWVEGVAIFVVSGQVPINEKGNYGRRFEKEQRTFGIAGIPITKYVGEFTKLAISLNFVDDLERCLEEILKAFRRGRPGPVWFDIPLDIQSATCDPINFDLLEKRVMVALEDSERGQNRTLPSDLLEKISSAKRPLVVIGSGAESSFGLGLLASWIEKTECVFALTRPNAHFFPISQVGNCGVLGVRGRPWSLEVLRDSDLIVALGSRLPSSLVGANYGYINKHASIILINNEKAEFIRHEGKIENKLPISVESFIHNQDVELAFRDNSNLSKWRLRIEELKHSLKKEVIPERTGPLNLYWFCQQLELLISSENVLTTDAGSNYYACGQVMEYKSGFREVTSGTFAAMGVSVPLAIGSAIALGNNKKIFCITGDGSIELNVQELQTISNYSLNVAIFIINNGGYASMRTWQDTFFDSRYIGSTDETGTKPMNFVKVASAFKIDYEKILDCEDFHRKIEGIVNSSHPILVEVMCDPNQVLDLPMDVDVV